MRHWKKAKRTLRAETLETRQLLHGGAIAGGGEPQTSEERATEVVGRFDANEDMELSAEEVSERLWTRISSADGDESGSVSVAELTTHLEARAAERAENEGGEKSRNHRDRGRSRGERVSIEDRIDSFFAENDTNSDGVITAADDVSEELLARIADADVAGDGVSAEDLLGRHEARKQARFDARFDALDENDDGGITEEEVSERRWERISAADGEGGDGIVTSEELQTYLDAQRAERQAEREAEAEVDEGNGEDVASEETASEDAASNETQRQTGQQRGRGRAVRRR